MNINRHNYEAFFLDYIEGRLSHDQEIELKEFLSSHPDLAPELDEYESIRLDAKEQIIFKDKSSIKKTPGELTPVTQLIALMEGDLAPQQAVEIKKKIESDEYLRAQSELLLKTKLVPDLNVRFPYKSKLRRKGKVVYMWRYAAAIAACLIIGLTFVLRNVPGKKQNESVAQKNIPLPSAPQVKDNANKQSASLTDNRKPVLQSLPKKLNQAEKIHKEKVAEQVAPVPLVAVNEIKLPVNNASLSEPVAVKENIQSNPASENTFGINDVFSEEELKELQNMSMASESSWVQQLAKESVNRLGELTGVKVQVPDKKNQQDVFAFSIGNFEVRHVSAK
jgi:hypothetical protein